MCYIYQLYCTAATPTANSEPAFGTIYWNLERSTKPTFRLESFRPRLGSTICKHLQYFRVWIIDTRLQCPVAALCRESV